MKFRLFLIFLPLITICSLAEAGDLKIEKRIAGENLSLVLSEGEKIYELYTFIPDSARDPFAQGTPLFLGVIERSGDKQRVIYFHNATDSFPADLRIVDGKIFVLLQDYNGKGGKIIEPVSGSESYSGLIGRGLWDMLDKTPTIRHPEPTIRHPEPTIRHPEPKAKDLNTRDCFASLAMTNTIAMYYVSSGELFEVLNGEKRRLADLNPYNRIEKISVNKDGIYISCDEGLLLYDFLRAGLIKITNESPPWFKAEANGGVLYLETNEIRRWSNTEDAKSYYKSDSEIWFIKKNTDSLLVIDDKITIISNGEPNSIEVGEEDSFANLRDAVFSAGSIIIYYSDTISRIIRGIKRRIRLHPNDGDRDLLAQLLKDQKIDADVIFSIVREDLNASSNNEEIIRNKLFALSLLELLGEEGFEEGKRIYLEWAHSISESIEKIFIEKLKKIDPQKTNELLIKKY